MKDRERIQRGLEKGLGRLDGATTPPGLRAAMRDAVLNGGSRLRPRLCLAVASACGDPSSETAFAAATAIEMLHCASLVHDDLPCFDDAPLRRGRPAVHVAHGEELAVLAGDGLIVMAFETVALCEPAMSTPGLMAKLVATLSRAAGAQRGLVCGQGWESESAVGLQSYHLAKTGALFKAAAELGALAAGAPAAPWGEWAAQAGEAYQVFDDLRDTGDGGEPLDKPMGQDLARTRPNAALSLGVDAAGQRLESLMREVRSSRPACARPAEADRWLERFTARLLPSLRAARTRRNAHESTPELGRASSLEVGT